jgi:hypothetical protein
MTVDAPHPSVAPRPAGPGRIKKVRQWFNPKKPINKIAVKVLQSADIVLGSIPGAEVAAEIKDVVLTAISD